MQYITTKAQLEEVAAAALGAMTEQSYYEFKHQTVMTPVKHPIMMLFWVLKQEAFGYPAGAEVVYPVKGHEWDAFLADIPTYCVDTPLVYVVDGTQYTAPI